MIAMADKKPEVKAIAPREDAPPPPARRTGPHWQSPGKGVPRTEGARKAPRDYIGEAIAVLAHAMPIGTAVAQNRDIVAAVIIAQALDRFGEKLIDAAAVSQYRRTP